MQTITSRKIITHDRRVYAPTIIENQTDTSYYREEKPKETKEEIVAETKTEENEID